MLKDRLRPISFWEHAYLYQRDHRKPFPFLLDGRSDVFFARKFSLLRLELKRSRGR
jgi:hypothetical protein